MTINQQIIDTLASRRLGLENALADPEIMTRLTVYLYDADALEAAFDLIATAENACQDQAREYGEQHQATQDVAAAFEAANEAYISTLEIARRMFRRDAGAITTLQLNGRRKSSLTGWLDQATTFYDELLANGAWQASLRGYTTQRLQDELNLVRAVGEANRLQEREKGEARAATDTRDAAVDACDDWWEDFAPYAQAALKDLPDSLALVLQGQI